MNSVVSPFVEQSIEDQVSDFVAELIRNQDWRFFCGDKQMSISMMSSNQSMLPAILWEAEKSHRFLLGSSMGIKFCADGEATVGAHAVIGSMAGRSRAEIFLFSMEALMHALEKHPSLGEDNPVTLDDLRDNVQARNTISPRMAAGKIDHLINAFFADQRAGQIPWTADSQPQSSNMSWADLKI